MQLQASFFACITNLSVRSVMHGDMNNRTLFCCIQRSSVFCCSIVEILSGLWGSCLVMFKGNVWTQACQRLEHPKYTGFFFQMNFFYLKFWSHNYVIFCYNCCQFGNRSFWRLRNQDSEEKNDKLSMQTTRTLVELVNAMP